MNEWVRGGEELGFVAMNGGWIHWGREVESGGVCLCSVEHVGRYTYYYHNVCWLERGGGESKDYHSLIGGISLFN